MSQMPQRVVPTLTEVLDVSEWQAAVARNAGFDTANDVPVEAPPHAAIEDAILQAITRAVDAAVDDFRAQLRPRVEAAVRQALAARTDALRGDD